MRFVLYTETMQTIPHTVSYSMSIQTQVKRTKYAFKRIEKGEKRRQAKKAKKKKRIKSAGL